MANPKNRTPEERSIIYGMALRGASRLAINEALAQTNARPLPPSSYRSIVRDYAPYLSDPERLARAIVSPPTWGDLRDAA